MLRGAGIQWHVGIWLVPATFCALVSGASGFGTPMLQPTHQHRQSEFGTLPLMSIFYVTIAAYILIGGVGVGALSVAAFPRCQRILVCQKRPLEVFSYGAKSMETPSSTSSTASSACIFRDCSRRHLADDSYVGPY